MQVFDFCFAWTWEYDHEFAQMLANACQTQMVSLLQVTPDNLNQVLAELNAGELYFKAFFDRASDADPSFEPLVEWACRRPDVVRINPFSQARRAWDKCLMQTLCSRAGLDTPETIALPPFLEQPDLELLDIKLLGERAIIKPAHGGGGAGVLEVSSAEQVLFARQEYPNDHYLLQEFISPAELDGRPAWFRVIYCAGQVFPCWWDHQTHVYKPVTWFEQTQYQLHELRQIPPQLARLSHLDLFSSEIAYTPDQRFVIVDYINDPVDLRLQSRAREGVPDHMVEAVARELALFVAVRTHAWYAYAYA